MIAKDILRVEVLGPIGLYFNYRRPTRTDIGPE